MTTLPPELLRHEEGEMVQLSFFLPREHMGYTKFILEGYDNLAIQTSTPGSTMVIWHTTRSRESEALALLVHLLSEFQ
ncbi:DUF4911 domain-containing protein [Myxococcota bacterium]|nr:DUF4911 domain-containing protein [Myxococcota bacterium]